MYMYQSSLRRLYLIQHLHLSGPHLQEDVVRLLHGAALGLGESQRCRQADEPQAVAVAEQAAGPQLRVGVETLRHLVSELDFLLGGAVFALRMKRYDRNPAALSRRAAGTSAGGTARAYLLRPLCQ